MIEVTPADVKSTAPEFSAVSDPTIEIYIDVARTFVCESKWGTKKAKFAIQYMTAFLMADLGLGSDGGVKSNVSGPVTMERVGDLSRSYGTVNFNGGSASEQILSANKYGRMFIMLRKTLLITPMVT